MSVLARESRWDEMAALIDDEVLHEWVVVAKYDELAKTLVERYGDVLDRVEVSIPIPTEEDVATLKDVVSELHQHQRT